MRGRFHLEACGVAIAVHAGLAIQRLGDAEIARGPLVEVAAANAICN